MPPTGWTSAYAVEFSSSRQLIEGTHKNHLTSGRSAYPGNRKSLPASVLRWTLVGVEASSTGRNQTAHVGGAGAWPVFLRGGGGADNACGRVLRSVWTVHSTAGGETRSGRTVAREAVQGDAFDVLAAAHSRALAKMSGDIAGTIRAEADDQQSDKQ